MIRTIKEKFKNVYAQFNRENATKLPVFLWNKAPTVFTPSVGSRITNWWNQDKNSAAIPTAKLAKLAIISIAAVIVGVVGVGLAVAQSVLSAAFAASMAVIALKAEAQAQARAKAVQVEAAQLKVTIAKLKEIKANVVETVKAKEVAANLVTAAPSTGAVPSYMPRASVMLESQGLGAAAYKPKSSAMLGFEGGFDHDVNPDNTRAPSFSTLSSRNRN